MEPWRSTGYFLYVPLSGWMAVLLCLLLVSVHQYSHAAELNAELHLGDTAAESIDVDAEDAAAEDDDDDPDDEDAEEGARPEKVDIPEMALKPIVKFDFDKRDALLPPIRKSKRACQEMPELLTLWATQPLRTPTHTTSTSSHPT